MNAVSEGRLTLDDIITKFHRNPKKIFNLPDQPNTYVEVDLDEEWEIPTETAYSKARWTPFAGRKIKGCIHRVVLRGEVAFIDGEVLVPTGFGENVRTWPLKKTVYHQSLEMLDVAAGGGGGVAAVPSYPSTEILHLDASAAASASKPMEIATDLHTNEAFAKLLSPVEVPPLPSQSAAKVHFAGGSTAAAIVADRLAMRPISPAMSRQRCDSTSNTKLLRDLVHQTTDNVDAHLHGLSNKHILSVDMFSKEQLNDIFDLAQIFKGRVAKDRPLDDILRGKLMASVFYEVSTRTSGSFAAAMQRLGGRVISMDETSSSVKKGETLEDSIGVLAGYADVIVLRHPEPGAVAVSKSCPSPSLFPLWGCC